MHTRISKIARLPAEIREQLNRRLHNGELGRSILPWVNQLPETKTVLAGLFAGKSITHQNLSEWRATGYQDWLFHQERLQWFSRVEEEDEEISKHDGCADTYEAMSRFFMFEIGQAMQAVRKIKNLEVRWARVEKITDRFARLQNAYNWSRRVQLEFDKYNHQFKTEEPTEPEVESENENLIEAEEVPQLESPQHPIAANEPAEPVAPSPCHEPEPKRHETSALQDAPHIPEAEDQHASVLDCGSPPPLSHENPLEPARCQPIPPYSPTTPQLPSQNSQTPNWKNHKVHSIPIRSRGFVCVEG